MSEFPEEILLAIEDARAGRSTQLKLRRWRRPEKLEKIPEQIFALSELQELDLSHNKIRIVPERIRELPKLKKLDLSHNPLTDVPDIPGLLLDWDSYLRCRLTLSSEHIVGIQITTGVQADRHLYPIPMNCCRRYSGCPVFGDFAWA